MKKEFSDKNSKIYVAGHSGLMGSAILRCLQKKGYKNFVLRTSSEIDLRDYAKTEELFKKEKPDFVIIAAAKVGGIKPNMTYPVDFLYNNLQIQNNLIHFSWKYGISKLLFLGSSCIYPREAPQPIKEEYFMTGPFEPTNQAYAVAKCAGIEMCRAYNKQYGLNFLCPIPTNLYGFGEKFDAENSHLIAALIKKFHEAKINGNKEAVLWGTGKPRREFMYADDAAEACLFLMEKYNSTELINVGLGEDKTVKEIAEIVKEVVGFNGDLLWDATKPDGMMRKLLDIQKMNELGWKAKTDLREGVKKTYEWYLENLA